MSRPCCATTRSNDPLDVEAERLHDVLAGLVRLIQLRDRNQICCHGLSVTQAHAIDALHRGSSFTLNDLATVLNLDKSTTSRVMDALERKGYVTRAPHPDDRRAVLLSVTASGKRLHHRIRKALVAEVRAVLEQVAPEVRTGVTELVATLAGRMAACVPGASDAFVGDACVTAQEVSR